MSMVRSTSELPCVNYSTSAKAKIQWREAKFPYPRTRDTGSARENTGDLFGLSFNCCTLKIHIYGQSIHMCLVRGNYGR